MFSLKHFSSAFCLVQFVGFYLTDIDLSWTEMKTNFLTK